MNMYINKKNNNNQLKSTYQNKPKQTNQNKRKGETKTKNKTKRTGAWEVEKRLSAAEGEEEEEGALRGSTREWPGAGCVCGCCCWGVGCVCGSVLGMRG